MEPWMYHGGDGDKKSNVSWEFNNKSALENSSIYWYSMSDRY
jgi:hypothetical protein